MADELLLYHYTTLQGIIGILGSECLWATDSRFLNDSLELEYGIREVAVPLSHEYDEVARYPDIDLWHYAGIGLQGPEMPLTDNRNGYGYVADPVFVTCFSEQGDLLSQWRGYGQEGGYALVFSLDDLRGALEYDRSGIQCDLTPVKYSKDEQEDLFRPLVENLMKGGPPNTPSSSAWCASAFRSVAVKCKHPGFHEEDEWRCVVEGFHSHLHRGVPVSKTDFYN